MMGLQVVVSIFAVVCLMPAQAVRDSDIEDDGRLAEVMSSLLETVQPRFPCDKLKRGVVKCDQNHQPKLLGRGSYGNAWLGEEPDSTDQVVIKLFYSMEDNEDGSFMYMTGADVPRLDELKWATESEVRNECPPGVLAYVPGPDGNLRRGAQRICRCLDSNFDGASDSELLYVKLQKAGDQLLTDYHREHAATGRWTIDLARKVLKQIFEGLLALESLHWVHHDLHPKNVMVREEGGEPLVQIIDFGSSIRGDREHACDYFPAGNVPWMPPENLEGPKVCPSHHISLEEPDELRHPAVDVDAPWAFDAFSAGLIMLQLFFASDKWTIFDKVTNTEFYKEVPNEDTATFAERVYFGLKALFNALDDPAKAEAVKAWEENMDAVYAVQNKKRNKIHVTNFADCMAELKKPAAAEFLKLAVELLQPNPLERPLVSALLDTAWMRETFVADNPHVTGRQ